ncbi:cystatin-like fold lipoprotein [Bacillus amyloliquefaciens]|nr:cystatin-like fold lipoprotein [Bacillus amyloliquefaciens]
MIHNVIKKYKTFLSERGRDPVDAKRDKTLIRVYDGGKYIQFAFYNDASLNYSSKKVSKYSWTDIL